ncbi:MAG: hypothetical protein ACREUU_19920, partial [Gammaproteobacteria bacterium]
PCLRLSSRPTFPRAVSKVHEVLFSTMPIFRFDPDVRIHEAAIRATHNSETQTVVQTVEFLMGRERSGIKRALVVKPG